MIRTLAIVALTSCLLCSSGTPGRADDDEVSFDEVMKSVRSGASLPLADIRARISGRIEGEIVRVTVKREHSRLIYEVRVLKANGRLVEAEVDAASGRILEIENE